jgi:hypothetical protein
VVHHRQDGEHADPVGDEVGGVLGADDALAQAGGEPGLQRIELAGSVVRVAISSTSAM